MLVATKDKPLATTITGSLPRPSWFRENLHGRAFSRAMLGDAVYREQYTDAVASLVTDQERAGLDIVTDGDMRFDMDIGGRDWFGYIIDRMHGLGHESVNRLAFGGNIREQTAGDILYEIMTTRLPPDITGPIARGPLDYAFAWKAGQSVAGRPLKFGACSAQLIDSITINDKKHYKDRRDVIMALSEQLNAEYRELADAGCPVIQVEEPCLHFFAKTGWEIPLDFYVEAFNREVEGIRERTELWCHTCWGNPLAQNLSGSGARYRPVLGHIDRLNVDVVTFETAENDGLELADIAAAIGKDKKIAIGAASHRRLQIETPAEVAALVRKAAKLIEPERLIISTDCGFGRQGMSRTHAAFKMIALVQGTNIVRRELGLPEAWVHATDQRLALL
jgi:5-methyltetrahydropteroyltriglutamate--homocysteine methyltransferase